jgi:hypothetical protein
MRFAEEHRNQWLALLDQYGAERQGHINRRAAVEVLGRVMSDNSASCAVFCNSDRDQRRRAAESYFFRFFLVEVSF